MDRVELRSPSPNETATRLGVAPRMRACFPFRAVILPWLVSRALADALIVAMARIRSPLYTAFAVKWDGGWYLNVAMNGYPHGAVPHGTESSWAFFPLLPAAARAMHSVGFSWYWGPVELNHVAFLVGLAGLYRIACRRTTPRAARLAVWTLALFPASFLFSMVYPCSIFLAASVWAFVFVEDRHDLAAGTCALVGTMVRPNGFVLAIALAVAIRFGIRRTLLVCGPALAGFVAWMVYNHDRTGDALAFYHAKSGWPEVDIVEFFTHPDRNSIPHALLAAATITALVLVWRKLPRSWLVFSGLYLVPSLITGMVGLGRYAGECFPAFVATGDLLTRWGRRWTALLLVACVALQAACVYWVIHLEFVP